MVFDMESGKVISEWTWDPIKGNFICALCQTPVILTKEQRNKSFCQVCHKKQLINRVLWSISGFLFLFFILTAFITFL